MADVEPHGPGLMLRLVDTGTEFDGLTVHLPGYTATALCQVMDLIAAGDMHAGPVLRFRAAYEAAVESAFAWTAGDEQALRALLDGPSPPPPLSGLDQVRAALTRLADAHTGPLAAALAGLRACATHTPRPDQQ